MNTITSLWTNAVENRRTWLIGSATAVVLAVLLIAAGEIGDWGWTRLVGAGVISVGSVVFGVLVGWAEPVRPRIRDWLYRQRKVLAGLLAAIMAAPLLVGLVLGVGGLAGDGDAGWGALLLGLLVTLLLLVATAGAIGIGVAQAIRGLDRLRPEENGHSDGQEPS